MGGKFHPRLNIDSSPIAKKYREGKVKRTLKRGLKVLEIAEGEANWTYECWRRLCETFCTSAQNVSCISPS